MFECCLLFPIGNFVEFWWYLLFCTLSSRTICLGSLHILVLHFSFFRHFRCLIFFTLNFYFARLALQNAYFKKSKKTEDDQNMKKDDQNTKKLSYQNETKQTKEILSDGVVYKTKSERNSGSIPRLYAFVSWKNWYLTAKGYVIWIFC